MMTKSLVYSALLASLCSAALADSAPRPPTPPPPPPPGIKPPVGTCTTNGDVLFQEAVRHEGWVDRKMKGPTWTVTLYATGGWTRTSYDADDKITASLTGCMSADRVQTVRDALARADWKSDPALTRCEAMTATYLEYSSFGRHLWDQHMCGDLTLRPPSRKALNEIVKLVTEQTTPHAPPCCKP